jgi:hypothetical protein
MCREMRAIFYDFFLDQMVLIRNGLTKKRLEKQGLQPRYFEVIRGKDVWKKPIVPSYYTKQINFVWKQIEIEIVEL